MRQFFFLMLFGGVGFLFSSCTKLDTSPCPYSILYVNGANIAFTGFSPEELDTVIIKRYKPDTSFKNFVDSVVVSVDSAELHQDTSYCPAYSSNWFLKQGFDYEFIVKATNQVYQVCKIETGSTIGYYERTEGRCGTRGSDILPYVAVTVNGVRQGPRWLRSSYYYVFLHR